MNTYVRKLHVATILAAFLVILIVHAPVAYSAQLTAQEKTSMVLRDVVGFDMTKYDTKLVADDVSYPSNLGGLPQEFVKYSLESDSSNLSASCYFINGTLAYCYLYTLQGQQRYAQPSASSLEMTKGLLQRYSNYLGVSYLQPMQNILDTLTELKPMTTTAGNLKFEISTTDNYTDIIWFYTVNGLDFRGKCVTVHFNNGALRGFSDLWSLYNVGSTTLKVSREEAINIARERAKNYQLFMNVGGLSNGTLVSVPFNILTYPVNTSLSMVPREPLTLYPFWQVWLWFDKPINNIYGLAVSMWADTGEFVRISQVGFYGSSGETSTAPSDSSSSPSSSSSTPTQPNTPPAESPNEAPSTTPPNEQATPTENTTATPASTYIIAAVAAAIIIPIAIAAIAIKKRRK
jgi:hypothetical protein